MLHPDYDVRKTAQALLKQLWKWCGVQLSVQLLDATQNMLSNVSSEIAEKVDSKWPSSKGICDCALTLVSIPNLSRVEAETLVFKVLLLANNSLAKSFDPLLYNKCLHKVLIINKSNLNILPLELIQAKTQSFIELTLESLTLNETQLNAIETLSNIDNKEYLKETVKYALSILSDTCLTQVTKEEFEIMKLKDGDLYDKSLIETTLKLQEAVNQNANLKRENKAYSYKEQLADIELKKELEKKKQAKSNIVTNSFNLESIRPQLSKKQQEMLDQQIDKENKIRKNVKKLDNLLSKATAIIVRLIHSNKASIKDYLVEIANSIINLAKSPLCSSYVFKIYKELANNIFMSNSISFGNAIVYCYARLNNLPITIEPNWTGETIDKCSKRLLLKIKNEEIIEFKENTIDISKAAFLLPFLHCCASKFSSIKTEDNSTENIVSIIKTFSLYRSKIQKDILERKKQHDLVEFNESFEEKYENDDSVLMKLINNFPASEYISLLLKIISSTDSIKIQNEVNETLKDIFKFTSNIDDDTINLSRQILLLQFSELTRYLMSPLNLVRETCLDCLSILVSTYSFLDETNSINLLVRIWVACYDLDENNRKKALNIWTSSNMKTNETLCKLLIDDVVHPMEHIRLAAAEGLAAALKNHQHISQDILDLLIFKYNEINKLPEPEVDQFGRLISKDESIDNWESRSGIANAFLFLADIIPNDYVVKLYSFFVNNGLNDRSIDVKNKLLEASIATLNKHGSSNKNELLALFETFLESAPKSAEYDSVRQNVVLLMGTLAKHLDKE